MKSECYQDNEPRPWSALKKNKQRGAAKKGWTTAPKWPRITPEEVCIHRINFLKLVTTAQELGQLALGHTCQEKAKVAKTLTWFAFSVHADQSKPMKWLDLHQVVRKPKCNYLLLLTWVKTQGIEHLTLTLIEELADAYNTMGNVYKPIFLFWKAQVIIYIWCTSVWGSVYIVHGAILWDMESNPIRQICIDAHEHDEAHQTRLDLKA